MPKKILSFFVIISILLSGVFFWQKSNIIHHYLTKIVNTEYLANATLTIGAVKSNSHELIFQQVTISSPQRGRLITAKQVQIDYSLWGLFKKNYAFHTIKKITIDEPHLTIIQNKKKQWNFTDLLNKKLAKQIPQFLFFDIHVKHGTLTFQDDTFQPVFITRLKQVNGRLRHEDTSRTYGNLSAENGTIKGNGVYDSSKEYYLVNLKVKDADSGIWGSYFLKDVKDWKIKGGKAAGNISISSFYKTKESLNYFCDLTFTKGIVAWQMLDSNLIEAKGRLKVAPTYVQLIDVQGEWEKSLFLGNAKVTDFKDPQIEVTVGFRNAPLPKLKKAFLPSFEKYLLEGKCSGTVTVMGPAKKMLIKGQLSSPECSFMKHNFKHTTAAFSLLGDSLNIPEASTNWHGVELKAYGRVAGFKESVYSFYVSADQTDLSLLKELDLKNKNISSLKGTAKSTFYVTGTMENPVVIGSISSVRGSYNTYQWQNLEANFIYGKDNLQILNSQMNMDNATISCQGSVWSLANPTVDLLITGNRIGLDNLPNHKVKGNNIRIISKISGQLDSPSALIYADAPLLQYDKFKLANTTGTMLYADRTLIITDLESNVQNSKITGSGIISLQKSPVFYFNLASNLELNTLSALAPALSPYQLAGKGYVQATLSGMPDDFKLRGNAYLPATTIAKIEMKNTFVGFNYDRNTLFIPYAFGKIRDGFIYTKGFVSVGPKLYWDFQGVTCQFPMEVFNKSPLTAKHLPAGTKFSGNMAGDFLLNSNVFLGRFRVNDLLLPQTDTAELNTVFALHGKNIAKLELYQAALENKTGYLSIFGSAHLGRELNLQALSYLSLDRLPNKKGLTGNLGLTASIKGTFSAPSLTGYGIISNGQLKSEKFAGSLNFSYKKNVLALKEVFVSQPQLSNFLEGETIITLNPLSIEGSFRTFLLPTEKFIQLTAYKPLLDMQKKYPVSGLLTTDGKFTCRGKNFTVSSLAQIEKLKLADDELGFLTTSFQVNNNRLTVKDFKLAGKYINIAGGLEYEYRQNFLRLNAQIKEFPLQLLANYHSSFKDLTGLGYGEITAVGNISHLGGWGKFAAERVLFQHYLLSKAGGDFVFNNGRLFLRSVALHQGPNTVTFSGDVNLSSPYKFNFDGLVEKGDFTSLFKIAGIERHGLPEGTFKAKLKLTGTPAEYVFSFNSQMDKIKFLGFDNCQSDLDFSLNKKHLDIRKLIFTRGGTYLSGKGILSLKKEESTFVLNASNLGLAQIKEFLQLPVPLQGLADLNITVKDNKIISSLEVRDGFIHKVNFDRLRGIVLYDGNKLDVSELRATKWGHYVKLYGSVPLKIYPQLQTGNLDFYLVSPTQELGILKLFSRNIEDSTGEFKGELYLKGTLDKPALSGSLEVKNGLVKIRDLDTPIRNVSSLLVFDNDQLNIKQFSALIGPQGKIDLVGYLILKKVVGDNNISLQINADKIYLKSPKYFIGNFDFSGKVTGSLKKADFVGSLYLHDSKFLIPYKTFLSKTEVIDQNKKYFTYLPEEKVSKPFTLTFSLPSFLPATNLNVGLKIGQNVGYKSNNDIELRGTGNLKLGGTLERPYLQGNMNLNYGKARFFGTVLDLVEGNLSFVKEEGILPDIHIVAKTDMTDKGLVVTINGIPPERIKVNIDSPSAAGFKGVEEYLSSVPKVVTSVVASSFLNPINTTLSGLISLSDVSFRMNATGNLGLTFKKQLSDRIYFLFTQNFSSLKIEDQQVISLVYLLSNKFLFRVYQVNGIEKYNGFEVENKF